MGIRRRLCRGNVAYAPTGDTPDDYVIATGESHSVKEFLIIAFDLLGLDWNKYVEIDPRYFRPTEVDFLRGDATKAREKIKWKPKVEF